MLYSDVFWRQTSTLQMDNYILIFGSIVKHACQRKSEMKTTLREWIWDVSVCMRQSASNKPKTVIFYSLDKLVGVPHSGSFRMILHLWRKPSFSLAVSFSSFDYGIISSTVRSWIHFFALKALWSSIEKLWKSSKLLHNVISAAPGFLCVPW